MVGPTGISNPSGKDVLLQQMLQTQKEILDVGLGQRPKQSQLKKWVTYEDLVAAGVLEVVGNVPGIIRPGVNLVPTTGPGSQAIPPAPTGLTATGGFDHIFLEWDNPLTLYSNHSLTRIYRADTDNFGAAVQIAQIADGFLFADQTVNHGQTYYYWIDFVSTSDISGAPNSATGTSAAVANDPAYLLSVLSGQITESELYGVLNNRLDLIDDASTGLTQQNVVKIDVNGYVAGYGLAVTTPTYDGGVSHSTMLFSVDTFAIGAPGATELAFVVDSGQVYMDAAYITNLVVNDAVVDTISVSKITGIDSSFILANIGTGNITNAYIGNVIQSDDYVTGVSGWIIRKGDGFAEFPGLLTNYIQTTDIDVVSTLMLQGQAVTIPTSAFTAGYVAIGSHTIAGQLQSVTFTSSGNPVHIVFTGAAHATLANHYLRLEVRRVINGGSAVVIRNAVSLFGSQIFENCEEEISLAINDTTAADGDVVTYSVWGYRGGGTATGMSVGNRAMLSVEHKQTGS